ncbi:MAG: tRNA pseudouridine55 synthase [Bacteroidia bacterium]|jgi:tRNA pseudouridine55 synthase
MDFNEGAFIQIDKPLTWTSFQVVKKIRYLTKAKKVGHAGTLDPLASGLLIICTGKFTKKIDQYQAQDKTYTGTFKIGVRTASFDAETPEEDEHDISKITNQEVENVAKSFVGESQQIPPIYSALKVGGKRAYALARAGEEVVMKPRTVNINEFKITRIALPEVDFEISCTKGTYIRSIARDFGKKLGVGAYLSALRRTKIGEYSVSDAKSIEEFENFIHSLKDESNS